jgi:tRNA pseudouridine55 synthase
MTQDGLLLVDKQIGPTSHDLVERVRRITGLARVGHTGTLDPTASGLLALVLGRATRLARFLPATPKVYTGRIQLGLTTTTDDLAGETRSRGPVPPADEVLASAATLRGSILQTPPAVSARKVMGTRLYVHARAGREVVAPPTPAEILRFDLEPTEEEGLWSFRAEVSAGTYIRALARDLGEKLGCGGALASLRRLAIGEMDVGQALVLPEDDRTARDWIRCAIVPLEAMPLRPGPVRLPDASSVRRFVSGVRVPAPGGCTPSGEVRVLDPEGRLLGIAGVRSGALEPRVVLARAPSPGERGSPEAGA